MRYIRTNGRQLTTEDIAAIAHAANRAYCRSHGDFSHKPWLSAPKWQRESARAGVQQILSDPTTTAEMSHASWCKLKRAAGWQFGPVKDAKRKTHPCLVPYSKLPAAQRIKDELFGAIVRVFI